MTVSPSLREFVRETLSRYGTITDRLMMGGATVYCDGAPVAIIADEELLLKADDETAPHFEAAGLEKFRFEKKDGSIATMNYFHVPDDFFDDQEVMDQWMALARDASLRAAAKKKPKRKDA